MVFVIQSLQIVSKTVLLKQWQLAIESKGVGVLVTQDCFRPTNPCFQGFCHFLGLCQSFLGITENSSALGFLLVNSKIALSIT